jgi:hypothetical protein
VSFGWIEFIVFTIVFDVNIAQRVNEDYLWGRQKNLRVIKILRSLKNVQFCSSSRKAKILIAGIQLS